jgi:hypothetical protein
VIEDLKADGKSDGDPPLVGWSVWADDDGDGLRGPYEPQGSLERHGLFDIKGLSPGRHTIRVELPQAYRSTSKQGPARVITVGPAGTVENVNFLYTQRAFAGGQTFIDADSDGKRDKNDAALKKWRVFIDEDGDGLLDKGERWVATDGDGQWSFKDLQPDRTYTFRVARKDSAKAVGSPAFVGVTLAAGEVRDDLNFARSRA